MTFLDLSTSIPSSTSTLTSFSVAESEFLDLPRLDANDFIGDLEGDRDILGYS